MPVGLLSVAPSSYLITISQREQVAQVRGCPIYVITDVALIPLSSQSEAQDAISLAKGSLKKSRQPEVPSSDSDASEDDEIQDEAGQPLRGDHISLGTSYLSTNVDISAARASSSARYASSVAEDVIEKKGQYGRFAERWFSKKGWTTERRRAQGMSLEGVEKVMTHMKNPQSRPSSANRAESSGRKINLEILDQAPECSMSGSSSAIVTNPLLPKLLRITRMLLRSRSFFFSYELDITRRLGTNDDKGSLMPLHRSADPLVSY